MTTKKKRLQVDELEGKIRWFEQQCRKNGLKVTPQRVVIYTELLNSDEHPSAEMVYEKVKNRFPSISLDTVNRTLMMLGEVGLAFVVEGSGDARRYDAGMDEHQHFKCVRCKKIIDFHHRPFDKIDLPANVLKGFRVLRAIVYVEGICNRCR